MMAKRSFEKFVFDSVSAAMEGISATEPEEGYSIDISDVQTISKWVEIESFTIDVVKNSRQAASDMRDGIIDFIDTFCDTTKGIMGYDLNSMTVSRDDRPGRWIYTMSISITHRRDFEWGE